MRGTRCSAWPVFWSRRLLYLPCAYFRVDLSDYHGNLPKTLELTLPAFFVRRMSNLPLMARRRAE